MTSGIRYCTTPDGVRIGYTVRGEGSPLIVCPGTADSFALAHMVPRIDEYHRELGRGRTLILYDMRGTGVSQRDVSDFSIAAVAADVMAVADAAGLDRFAVVASNFSGPRAVYAAAEHPERVSQLVLFDTTANPHEAFPYETAAGLAGVCRSNWKLGVQMVAEMGGRSRVSDSDDRARVGEESLLVAAWLEKSVSGEQFAAMVLEAYESWNVSHLLPQVQARTLIVHHQDNILFNVSNGQKLAAGIPDATFVNVEGVFSGPTTGSIPRYNVEIIHRFLDEGTASVNPPRETRVSRGSTAIILFADIVESTALTERLGDAAFRAKARDLDTALRKVIRDAGGTTVEGKLLGDGVLAVFSSARQAIGAALKCGAAGEEGGLPLHLGLHAGDVIEEDGNVFGGAVNIAARIAGESASGEVLVSQTVRELARTSAGVAFEDAGERELKGVGDAVRVWRVVKA